MQIWNPSSSFTRPNNVTAYANGQLIANSTTAGSVVPLSFQLGNAYPTSQCRLNRIRITKTGTGVPASGVRLHLYQTSSITCANGDGGAWSTNQAANWLGNIDVSTFFVFTDGAAGFGAAAAGSEFMIRTSTQTSLYGLLVSLGAYTPVANEVFTVTLEDLEAY
jgi:hypothetical protein